MHDFESSRSDETQGWLPAVRVRFEGNQNTRSPTELPTDSPRLLGRGRAKDRIVKRRRAADEERITEDQLQAMVVRQVVPGGKPDLVSVPGDDLPVPPGSLGEPDRRVLEFGIHAQPFNLFGQIEGYKATKT
ncbi:hypothetical protein [Streptomyces sp. NPDC053079]|uniref:hypothetical protein n=1 Tax=Streptomyces sp. NPDC053079 TaxID=3365697 RepID=UPI0037CE4409